MNMTSNSPTAAVPRKIIRSCGLSSLMLNPATRAESTGRAPVQEMCSVLIIFILVFIEQTCCAFRFNFGVNFCH
jgi:hypothetical protein